MYIVTSTTNVYFAKPKQNKIKVCINRVQSYIELSLTVLVTDPFTR